MRKLSLAFGLIAGLFCTSAYADFTGKNAAAATITFKNAGDCTAVVCVPVFNPVDNTGANFGVTANPFFVTGSSGTFPVTGTFWQATQPVSGTFWQATQPVSGTVTANAGTNLNTSALGTAANQATIITALGTLNTTASAPPPLNLNGVNTAWTGLTPGVAQTGTIVVANVDATSKGGVSYGAMANYGTSPGTVKVDGVNAFITNIPHVIVDTAPSTAVTNAGTFAVQAAATLAAETTKVIGTVNQGTSPWVVSGTVTPLSTTNAGGTLVKGGVGVVNGGSTYQLVAASATATVLQTSTGAIGDYLSHCVAFPTSTSPGVVTILDNATALYSFPGGASSVSNLVPFAIPVGAVSTSGAWKITTGASISVVCSGKFS